MTQPLSFVQTVDNSEPPQQPNYQAPQAPRSSAITQEDRQQAVSLGSIGRAAFEAQAVLAYLQHEAAYTQPLAHIPDVMAAAQKLADDMDDRGFFPDTNKFRRVPERMKIGNASSQNGQGINRRTGDDPQAGDHRVQVYPGNQG